MSGDLAWDYIVIGAGSAGCALAGELARLGDARVLILEAGGSDRSPFIRFPAGQIQAIKRHDWGFTSQPDPSRNGKSESWGRGRVVGGSSSINGTIYVRGAASDFDAWASEGNKGWSYEDILPIYREMERSDRPGPVRGHEGSLYVHTVQTAHPLTHAFVRSAQATGIPFNEDYNGGSQEGVSYIQLTVRRGLRCSAAVAFLKPALHRRNIKLLLQCTVQRIDLRSGHASGVSFLRRGTAESVSGRHIILCAGAINSPKLLMLSGIGDPEELTRHGIAPKVSSPDVGRNLQEHPLLNLTYRMRVPSNNLTEGIGQKLSIALQFLAKQSGPIANLFEATAFVRSAPEAARPDIQLHFLSLGYIKGPGGTIQPADYPAVTVLLNKSHPMSRGRIRLASADPVQAPRIDCRLLEDRADVQTLLNGVGVVRKIMAAAPIADLIDKEVTPGAHVLDRAALEAYIRGSTEIAYHPVGTCRMGPDARAVVTPDLRVNGVENLWVADASIIPSLISGNTNAVCMMIGKKLGRQLSARRA